MTRKSPNRVVRAVTDVMWARDRLQMRAADRLLSLVNPTRTPRRAAQKTGRRSVAKTKR